LLTITGGIFDAYTYLLKGQVFANAQTSNVVLFGIHLASRDMKAFHYLFPLCAFILGGFLASETRRWFEAHIKYNWEVIILLFEALFVFIIAFIPDNSSWHDASTFSISFITAVQYSAFREIKGLPFATTMCTGMLRSSADSLYEYLNNLDKAYLKRGLLYLMIIGFFAIGCSIGAIAIKYLGQYAIWLCSCLFILCIAIYYANRNPS
jgi:uncharacterized membrane protein YoaK (UPF0700 family)